MATKKSTKAKRPEYRARRISLAAIGRATLKHEAEDRKKWAAMRAEQDRRQREHKAKMAKRLAAFDLDGCHDIHHAFDCSTIDLAAALRAVEVIFIQYEGGTFANMPAAGHAVLDHLFAVHRRFQEAYSLSAHVEHQRRQEGGAP